MITTQRPSAVESMRKELAIIQREISTCLDECGNTINAKKYRLQDLIVEAKFYKKSIDWMESLKAERNVLPTKS